MDHQHSSSSKTPGSAHAGPGDSEAFLPELPGYDMIDEIGRGGMGIVYEAYQQSTSRRVAVKFLMERIAASESSRRRFEREVELIARLQHPAVVSVLDSGIHEGRYFFAMEFIEGTPLDEKLAPGKADVRTVLALMAQICDAVDYAHQRGVLHRDLKPSNVLIDADGRPHLLDFGLAKGIDPHSRAGVQMSLSEPGHLIGTLGYMSPEQSRAEYEQMSVRSDVYSLGAIAYELITGKLPCGVAGPLAEVLRGIAERDAPKPSTLRRDVHADVDAILLKAIEKSPASRYATAADLAADIRRYLADQPITARPPSTVDHIVKWVRRNRAIAFTAGAALGLIVAITVVSFRQIIAERDSALAKGDFLDAAIATVDTSQGTKMKTLLTNMVEIMDRGIERDLQDHPAAEASVRLTVGSILMQTLQRYEEALGHFDAAIAINEDLYGANSLPVAKALVQRGRSLFFLRRFPESLASYERALSIRQRLTGTRSEASAECLHEMASVYREFGEREYDRAERLYNEALEIRTVLFGSESWQAAATMNNLALLFNRRERFAEAEIMFNKALAALRNLPKPERKPLFEARTLQNLGDCLIKLKRDDEAQAVFREALQLKETWFDDDSLTAAKALQGLAEVSLKLNRFGEAKELCDKALALLKRHGSEAEIKRGEEILQRIKDASPSPEREQPDRSIDPESQAPAT